MVADDLRPDSHVERLGIAGNGPECLCERARMLGVDQRTVGGVQEQDTRPVVSVEAKDDVVARGEREPTGIPGPQVLERLAHGSGAPGTVAQAQHAVLVRDEPRSIPQFDDTVARGVELVPFGQPCAVWRDDG